MKIIKNFLKFFLKGMNYNDDKKMNLKKKDDKEMTKIIDK